jgi:hypothetical protein
LVRRLAQTLRRKSTLTSVLSLDEGEEALCLAVKFLILWLVFSPAIGHKALGQETGANLK